MAWLSSRREIAAVSLIALLFLLSAVLPLLSSLNMLIATPIFLLLRTAADERTAVALLRNGLLIAAGGVLLIGEPALFIFSLTMLPLSWSLHRSAKNGLSPAAAGGLGIAALSLTWTVFWLMQGLLTGNNPYVSLLILLDTSLAEAGAAYRASAELSLELTHDLNMMAEGMRQWLPKMLPGLLAGSVVLIVWLNLVIGSGLLRHLQPDKAVWPEYRCWRLPERLIWLLITAAVLSLFGNGNSVHTGYSMTIVAGLLYFFQGLAIFAHLLHRWHVPAFWRTVLYFFVAAQGYGMLLLAVTGVADTWADFRRLTQNEQPADRS